MATPIGDFVSGARLRGWVDRTLDLLLPPGCVACGVATSTADTLCLACWSRLDFIAAPACDRCGAPLPIDLGPGAVCGGCAATPPPWSRGRAAVRYDDASKPLILGLKNHDRHDLVPTFARWMARAGRDVLDDADLLAPVPLHWTRLMLRTYNQAGLLSRRLAIEVGRPHLPDALIRVRRTPKLGHMNPAQRKRAVAAAIAVRAGARSRVDGARIVLIDDVLTTGSTLRACARALLAAGAERVNIVVLARATRDVGAA